MHSFLRAIGFDKDMGKKDIDAMIDDIVENPTKMEVSKDSLGNEIVLLTKEYGRRIGVTVCGEYLEDDSFCAEYYYPYFTGMGITTEEKIDIEKHSEKESYAGICDEMRLGVTLIFYLQNVADYLSYRACASRLTKAAQNENSPGRKGIGTSVTMSGLSLSGKILLPIGKTEKQQKNLDKSNQKRSQMIAAAREGDEEAIESLTLEDIDTYSMITRRVANEDILSIVESYFMPYGIESDQYSILGEILDCYQIRNERTQQNIWVLTIDCNDIIYDICINSADIVGEPTIGRRFKGNIWMQGYINY